MSSIQSAGCTLRTTFIWYGCSALASRTGSIRKDDRACLICEAACDVLGDAMIARISMTSLPLKHIDQIAPQNMIMNGDGGATTVPQVPPTTASKPTPPNDRIFPLIRLPRELRNEIYDYFIVDYQIDKPDRAISPDDATQPDGRKGAFRAYALLLVSRQVNAEFTEHTCPRSRLFVELQSIEQLEAQMFNPYTCKPQKVLSQIRNVVIWTSWHAVVKAGSSSSEFHLFWTNFTSGTIDQSADPWTPSKGEPSRSRSSNVVALT